VLVLLALMCISAVSMLVIMLLQNDDSPRLTADKGDTGDNQVHELTEEEIAAMNGGRDFLGGAGESIMGKNGTQAGADGRDARDGNGKDLEEREMKEPEKIDPYNFMPKDELPKEDFYIYHLTDELIDKITGVSYPDMQETQLICYDDLAYVHVKYIDFNDLEQDGEIICNKAIAQDLLEIFTELHRQRYQIESVKLVDDFGADDENSMAANNSSCFNYRNIAGTDRLSNHSYGCAIDINPFYNPYITTQAIAPAGAEIYADRKADFPHKIDKEDLCYRLFTEHGFTWGGDWNHSKDYQHFEKAINMDKMAPVIVAIDPGHGGENEGGKFGEYTEKDMTPMIATSLKRELEKYQGVQVCLTRTDDSDISLDDRVDYAKKKHAAFFCALHLNMSDNHNLFGAECWVSAFDSCYAAGNDLSLLVMDELTTVGLFDRGIKTRFNSRGTDYYGVIRQATKIGMPSVIIEHCHIDNRNDAPFLDKDGWLRLYGRLDARALAKYYGLKSDMLGEDYSELDTAVTEVPSEPVRPDESEPDVCRIDSLEKNKDATSLAVEVTSYDNESRILYYSVSLDGGNTFCDYKPWPKGERTAEITVDISNKKTGSLVVNTCNLHGVDAFSEPVKY